MKYRIFNTEAEAIAAEAQVAAAIGCIKIGTNAKTGLPAPDAQATERWATPQQITDGRWVFPSRLTTRARSRALTGGQP
jgi:hypothetical protein